MHLVSHGAYYWHCRDVHAHKGAGIKHDTDPRAFMRTVYDARKTCRERSKGLPFFMALDGKPPKDIASVSPTGSYLVSFFIGLPLPPPSLLVVYLRACLGLPGSWLIGATSPKSL